MHYLNDVLSPLQVAVNDIYEDSLRYLRAAESSGASGRPDRALDGRLGFSFFLLELYKNTADPAVFESIRQELRWLDAYCGRNPTNNYSLFCGRLGLSYLYVMLFEHTGERTYLTRATGLVYEYYHGNAFKYGIITHKGLFNGTAGIILLTQRLYLLTGDKQLLTYLERLLLQLVRETEYSGDGIHWGGITNKQGENTGIATGAAGIAFVLAQLGDAFNAPFLGKLARFALRYEEKNQANPDPVPAPRHGGNDDPTGRPAPDPDVRRLSLGYGTAGTTVARLRLAADQRQPPALPEGEGAGPDQGFFPGSPVHDQACGLFSGLSGIGLAALQVYRATGRAQYYREATAIAGHLAGRCSDANHAIPYSLEGTWGIGYFLLQCTGPASAAENETFFLPRPRQAPKATDLPTDSAFREANRVLYETYVSSSFGSTLAHLKKEAPQAFSALVSEPEFLEPREQAGRIRQLISGQEGLAGNQALMFELDKEEFILSVRGDLQGSVPPGLEDILPTYEQASLDQRAFASLTLVQSDQIYVFSRDPAFSPELLADPGSLSNFMQQYGTKTLMYRLTPADTLHASRLGILKIIFDRFVVAAPTGQVHAEILAFLLQLPDEVLEEVVRNYRERTSQSPREILSGMVWDGIEHCFTEGLLQVHA